MYPTDGPKKNPHKVQFSRLDGNKTVNSRKF